MNLERFVKFDRAGIAGLSVVILGFINLFFLPHTCDSLILILQVVLFSLAYYWLQKDRSEIEVNRLKNIWVIIMIAAIVVLLFLFNRFYF